jgi:hypothetical protein
MALASTTTAYIASRVITLDANRELVLVSSYNAAYTMYAFVYNSSTNTFGAVATIRATASTLGAILIATDKVLVASIGSSGTSLEAVVLSISTNTITVNTAATATLGGVTVSLNTVNSYPSFVTVGTSYVLSYGRATTVSAILAFTVSGTTVTIGSETVLTPASATAAALYPISSSVVLALSASSTVFYATPYTVSGVTLTVGTGATTTIDTANWYPIGTFQSGQIGVLFKNATWYGGVISVSGTTASISSAQIFSASVAMTASQYFAVIIGDKMLCYYGGSAYPNNLVNVLTNTSGTASAGTEIPGGSGVASLYINGNLLTTGLDMPVKYSISGSNAIETIVDTNLPVFAASLTGRIWITTALNSYGVLRSATKTMTVGTTVAWYMNSDGTASQTVPKSFGSNSNLTAWIGPGEGASGWAITYRTASTVTATKVTLS